MKFRDHSQDTPSQEMQLAPMIDIVFLLLVFFVVSWNFAKFEAEINIAVPEQEESDPSMNRPPGELVVSVMEDGTVQVNRQRMTQQQLFAKLSRVAALFPGQPVILRTEENAEFYHMVNVLDTCQKAGTRNVAFASFIQ